MGRRVSWAPLVAAVAGACLAGALVELGAAGIPRPRRGLGRRLLRRAPRPVAPRGLAARVEAAGVGLGAGDVMAAKLAAAIAGGRRRARPRPASTAVAARRRRSAAGSRPTWSLRSRARARARAIEAELADVLDLLRVAVGAGLTPWRALAEVGRRHPGVLAAELGATARRIALGVPPGRRARPLRAAHARWRRPRARRRRSGAPTGSAPPPAGR